MCTSYSAKIGNLLMSTQNVPFLTHKVKWISTRMRLGFDVVTTLFGRQQRCYNVKTTLCAYWVINSHLLKTIYVTYQMIWSRQPPVVTLRCRCAQGLQTTHWLYSFYSCCWQGGREGVCLYSPHYHPLLLMTLFVLLLLLLVPWKEMDPPRPRNQEKTLNRMKVERGKDTIFSR